jgi:alcohol dehydrogenase class IV
LRPCRQGHGCDQKDGEEMELFSGVNPDPTDQNVREGLAEFK